MRNFKTRVVMVLAVPLLMTACGSGGQTGTDSTTPTAAAASSTTAPEAAPGSNTPAPSSRTKTPSAKRSVPAPSASVQKSKDPKVSAPVKIDIPSTGEGSSLLTLGTAADQTIVVPNDKQADQAGWYDGSPEPGENGPATIVGHSTSSRGAAVFFKLAEVQKGAAVNVTTENGTVLKFTVYQVANYPKKSFPTAKVYGNTDGPELRVVTCGGTFDKGTGHLEDNTVLYARLAA